MTFAINYNSFFPKKLYCNFNLSKNLIFIHFCRIIFLLLQKNNNFIVASNIIQ